MVTAERQSDSLREQLALLDDTSDNLLGSFLRTVSHDLKTPLLTVSLALELLGDAFPDDDRGRVAREALSSGMHDLEDMLDAVTGVSRARRRILRDEPTSLVDVLTGHMVISDAEVSRILTHVDTRSVTEAFSALSGGSLNLRLELVDDGVAIAAALPETLIELDGSCVAALLGSLTQYADTPVAKLAACEVLLTRQGGALRCGGGRLWLQIPAVIAE